MQSVGLPITDRLARAVLAVCSRIEQWAAYPEANDALWSKGLAHGEMPSPTARMLREELDRVTNEDPFTLIVKRAKEEGVIWLAGEMEVPVKLSAHAAYNHCFRIAEQCGYNVGWYGGCKSMLLISGPGILGAYVLDYFSPDPEVEACAKIIHLSEREAWL